MDTWILHVCDELERRLDEPRLVERLADAMQVSPDGLGQRFADATGLFPDEYLRRVRLARAKVLLERTFLSERQVMASVGLDDLRAFEAAFERQYGLSPTALRDRAWNGREGTAASNGPTANIPDRRRTPRN